MKYFLLRQDVSVNNKWALGCIRYVDNWMFIDPPVNFMEPGGYTLDVIFEGAEVDYSLAGYASVPVLSGKACDALSGIREVDEPCRHVVFAPVQIEGGSVSQQYFLMIIEAHIDCVDEKRSEFLKFQSDDPVRPDLAGNYQAFFNLVIDSSKVGPSQIFRIKEYSGAIIVSEDIKARFEKAGLAGGVFESVNGDRVTVA